MNFYFEIWDIYGIVPIFVTILSKRVREYGQRWTRFFCHSSILQETDTMSDIQLGIYPLPYEAVSDLAFLQKHIYPDMRKNYYWSEDFSAQYYIAQAKAGFIAVTDTFEGKELLLPEIQFSYALLHFEDLHISRKVKRLLSRKKHQLHITTDIDAVVERIQQYHRNCWLTPKYHTMLKKTQQTEENFQIFASYITHNGKSDGILVAGEIGYMIGNTYTSLSGFSSREKAYRNYGTLQLVLLARFLQEHDFAFWNLGQSYMPYKFHLGAKQYDRHQFLKLWYTHI
jgi:Leu/Phe-tRNA-protein transferase